MDWCGRLPDCRVRAGVRIQHSENIQRSAEREKLQKQIAALENKIRKEKQFNRQVEMTAELKQLKKI